MFYRYCVCLFVSGGFRSLAEPAFPSCSERPSLTAVLLAVAALVAEHRLEGMRPSLVVAHRLGCLEACEFFLDPGWNPCPCVGRQILDHWISRDPRDPHFSVTNLAVFWSPSSFLLIKILLISFIFSHNHSSFSLGKAQECYNIIHL